jgi:hypothetical protein
VSPRAIATAYALGRVGIGAALALAPGRAARSWIGDNAESPAAQLLTSALGIRDVGLGAGTLTALRRGGETRPWLQACAAADLVDFLATVRNRDDVPTAALIGVGALASGSAALGAWLATRIEY